MLSPYIYLLLLSNVSLIFCQRNAEAEGRCQPFLTSSRTAPLTSHKRNIKRDEEGEFYCELVLQDRYLPSQIRVTIHEGLAYLAIRHVQMGLQRHRTVKRHLKILVEMLPSSFRFNSKAGTWLLDPNILNVEEAITYLENALYYNASMDPEASDELKVIARRDLARAYTLRGDYISAQQEYYNLLQISPSDFGIAFYLRQVSSQIPQGDGLPREALESALQITSELYSEIQEHQYNHYSGFTPDSSWLPEEHLTLPTVSEFSKIVQTRQPYLIRGSKLVNPFESLLNWNISSWMNDPNYLLSQAKSSDPDEEELTVLVERRKRPQISPALNDNGSTQESRELLFGFGFAVHHVHISFREFLQSYFCDNSSTESSLSSESCSKLSRNNWIEYLNIQDLRDSNGSIWRPPLSIPSLKKDISIPLFLNQFVEDNTMSDINLWMGNTHMNQGYDTKSRLHMDAMDNLYVLMSGRKVFRIVPPHLAARLQTISPTYGILPNGFSFQYSFATPLSDNERSELLAGDDPVIDRLVNGDTYEYDSNAVKYYHFSDISDVQELKDIQDQIIEIQLDPGDILFLPAGWFHQVTSSGGRHMAINYWWRPAGWEETVNTERKYKYQLLKDMKERRKKKSSSSFLSDEL